MGRIDDLIHKLSVAASAEGKSVSVMIFPTKGELASNGESLGKIAAMCSVASLASSISSMPSVGALGPLHYDKSQEREDTVM